MTVAADIERVQALVTEIGTDAQREWFDNWTEDFASAVDSAGEDAYEDLHIALIAFERLELWTPSRLFTLGELIISLGLDPADFRDS